VLTDADEELFRAATRNSEMYGKTQQKKNFPTASATSLKISNRGSSDRGSSEKRKSRPMEGVNLKKGRSVARIGKTTGDVLVRRNPKQVRLARVGPQKTRWVEKA